MFLPLTRTAIFKVGLVFVIATVCCLAIFGAGKLISRPAKEVVSSGSTPSRKDDLEAQIITLLPTGFEPAEISWSQGPVVLSIHNRSGLEEVSVRLEVEAGPRFKEVKAPRNRLNIKELVDLHPGRYRLTEINNPEWSCVITVTPRDGSRPRAAIEQ